MILRLIVVCFLSVSPFVSSEPTLRKFAQISDIHLDLEYEAGGEVAKFCRLGPSLLPEGDGGASKYGDYKCDSPKKLVISAIRYLEKVLPDPDFILWTGDSSPHWKDESKKKQRHVYNNLRMITKELHERFPNTTIIPALGNHDSQPADFFPDPYTNRTLSKRIYSGYIEQGSFGDLLKDFPEAKTKFKECGFYTIKKQNYAVNVTQTFVVLNTNLYYNNKASTKSDDPCDQLKWLNKELQEAKDNERIFIIGRVPPGFFELNPWSPFFNNDSYTKTYSEILTNEKAAKKVVAHFYGHTHTDAFRFFIAENGAVQGVGFIAPSVTPLMFQGGTNPSIRIYHYSPENRTIVDYETHSLQLDKLIVGAKGTESSSTVEQETEDEFGEAKSRRKNSKLLDREKRQFPAAENEKPVVKKMFKDNNDTFEDLVTESTSVSPNVTESNTTSSNIILSNTTLPNSVMLNSTTAMPEGEVEVTTLEENSDVMTTTVMPEEKPQTENTTTVNTDPDIDFLVGEWSLAYRKKDSLKLENLSTKSLYKSYLQMKNDREHSKFKVYFRQTWVDHDPLESMECDSKCHRTFMCAMVHFTSDDFYNCTGEGVTSMTNSPVENSQSPFTEMTPLTSTTTYLRTLTTSSYFGTVADSGKPDTDPDSSESSLVRGVGIGFALIALIAIAGFAFAFYRRTRLNRYRSQEFLLTDSVFRYDGYAQVEQP